jgi:YesN/AraC family two-component response regulator
MRMTLLIADDNQRMREAIKRTIRGGVPDDHTIYEASDGSEAIHLYERVRPDWVVMDIKMEPIDGLVASRAIMALNPDANIIILTQYNDGVYHKAAKDAGARAFLLKEHLSEIPTILSECSRNDSLL